MNTEIAKMRQISMTIHEGRVFMVPGSQLLRAPE
jgi:hypothetical protein